jgi:hypothetical protein
LELPKTAPATRHLAMPRSVKVNADLYFGFVRGAPVRLLDYSARGQLLADMLVTQQAVPYGCDHHHGPGPAA